MQQTNAEKNIDFLLQKREGSCIFSVKPLYCFYSHYNDIWCFSIFPEEIS